MRTKKRSTIKALLIIDMQNDFCPGGKLAVPQGDRIVPVLNRYVRIFSTKNLPIFATRECHPRRTEHFNDFIDKWFMHCVRRMEGACFHPDLRLPKQTIILYKGMAQEEISSSVFKAVSPEGNNFYALLNFLGVKELYIGGLATDYSVKATALDAIRNGFRIRLLTDAVKGVNQKDSKKIIKKLLTHGVKGVNLK